MDDSGACSRSCPARAESFAVFHAPEALQEKSQNTVIEGQAQLAKQFDNIRAELNDAWKAVETNASIAKGMNGKAKESLQVY